MHDAGSELSDAEAAHFVSLTGAALASAAVYGKNILLTAAAATANLPGLELECAALDFRGSAGGLTLSGAWGIYRVVVRHRGAVLRHLVVLAFRGTKSSRDMLADVLIAGAPLRLPGALEPPPPSPGAPSSRLRVHAGILAYASAVLEEALLAAASALAAPPSFGALLPQPEFWLAGHSLGGGVAHVFGLLTVRAARLAPPGPVRSAATALLFAARAADDPARAGAAGGGVLRVAAFGAPLVWANAASDPGAYAAEAELGPGTVAPSCVIHALDAVPRLLGPGGALSSSVAVAAAVGAPLVALLGLPLGIAVGATLLRAGGKRAASAGDDAAAAPAADVVVNGERGSGGSSSASLPTAAPAAAAATAPVPADVPTASVVSPQEPFDPDLLPVAIEVAGSPDDGASELLAEEGIVASPAKSVAGGGASPSGPSPGAIAQARHYGMAPDARVYLVSGLQRTSPPVEGAADPGSPSPALEPASAASLRVSTHHGDRAAGALAAAEARSILSMPSVLCGGALVEHHHMSAYLHSCALAAWAHLEGAPGRGGGAAAAGRA